MPLQAPYGCESAPSSSRGPCRGPMSDPPTTKPDPRPTATTPEQRALDGEEGPPDSASLPRANRSVQGQPQPAPNVDPPADAPEDPDAPVSS